MGFLLDSRCGKVSLDYTQCYPIKQIKREEWAIIFALAIGAWVSLNYLVNFEFVML